MPYQVIELSERYYRRLLYSCASLLSIAVVCALLFLSYSTFTQFRERQVATFIIKREQIKSEVDRLSTRILLFSEMHTRLQHLQQRDLLPLQAYIEQLGSENVTLSPEDLTVIPFSLVIRRYFTEDKKRISSLLLLLRQASALPMFDPSNPGATLDGFIYSADYGFLAISPPLRRNELDLVGQQSIARFINGLSSPVDTAFAAELERAAQVQGSGGQRVLWMSPALSAPLMRDAVTRLAVRINLVDKGDMATAVFSVPASQFREFFMKNDETPGLFVFEGKGSTRLLNRPPKEVSAGLMKHIEQHLKHVDHSFDHAGHFHEDGSFFIAQTIEGPEWVVVYTFTWRDVLTGLRGDFTTGAFWGLFSLLFIWAATLYFDKCVIGPLQKKALAMVESQQFSRTIIDTLPVGIAVYAPASGEVVLRNSVTERMLEQSVLPCCGFYTQILTAVRVGDNLQQAMIEAELPLRDGSVSYLGVVWSRTRFSGQDVLLLGMVDLNIQKAHEILALEAKTMADKANAAKSMFLAQVSHEIRTPLHGAIGHMELLAREDLSPQQRGRINLIRHAFDMLMSLVNDILDITKIESNSITLGCEELNVNDLLEECAQLFAPLAMNKGLQFYCLPSPVLERAFNGDRKRLMQLLHNLVSNAVKFTEHGSVTLSTLRVLGEQGLPMVRFEVADTGIGISPSARHRIFKPLQQADDSISQRFGGTGLGLSLCRRLAELMGGRITLSSEEGVGSVFGADIPLMPVLNTTQHQTRVLEGRTVALHCKKLPLRSMLEAYLECWGATVAQDTAVAIAQVHLIGQDCFTEFVASNVQDKIDAVLITGDMVRFGIPSGRWKQVSAFDRTAWQQALSDNFPVPALPHATLAEVGELSLDILVAEDDHINLTLINHQLQTLGCRRLRLVRNGTDALAQWQAHRPDLLITDLGMPGLDGVMLATRIRQQDPHALIIATTAMGRSTQSDLPPGLFDHVIYKPGSLDQLRDLLLSVAPQRTIQRMEPATEVVAVQPFELVLQESFRQSWPQEKRKFQQTLQDGQLPQVARILHRLQGGLQAMGYETLAHESQVLQAAIEEGEGDVIARCLHWAARVENEILH